MIKKIDHFNIVVQDLELVKNFFLKLGFKLDDQAELSGDNISAVVGLKDVKAEYVKLSISNDSVSLELIRYDQPAAKSIAGLGVANTMGFRHLAFEVDDIEQTLTDLKAQGVKPLSAIQEYQPTQKKLVYFLGPEDILLELAEYGAV